MIMADEYNGPEYGRSLNGAGVLRISRSAKIRHGMSESIKIGTWNVRSMYEAGKIHNTIREMKRLRISVLGVSEMRWPQSGVLKIEDCVVYYAGADGAQHKNGVAIIVTNKVAKAVKNFTPISDRITMVQMATTTVDINIIQVYAPTSDAEEEQVDKFYADLEQALSMTKNRRQQ